MVKNMKRKEMKNENENTLAAMGMGAMIVFIALILVAAVASAVIIQTAEKLQQNAQTTGDQTQQQMASKISLLSVVVEIEAGVAPNAGAPNDVLRVTFELAPGSENVDPANAVWNVVCDDGVDAGDLTGFARVSTHTAAQIAAGLIYPGEVYTISIGVGAAGPGCAMELNTAHYLMFQAGNAGFTYEVLNYGGSNAVGTVII